MKIFRIRYFILFCCIYFKYDRIQSIVRYFRRILNEKSKYFIFVKNKIVDARTLIMNRFDEFVDLMHL